MCRAIGFLVVAGFALFGASKFIEDHVVLDGEDPDQLKGGTDDSQINALRVVTGQEPA